MSATSRQAPIPSRQWRRDLSCAADQAEVCKRVLISVGMQVNVLGGRPRLRVHTAPIAGIIGPDIYSHFAE
jgi:hypothetical protein